MRMRWLWMGCAVGMVAACALVARSDAQAKEAAPAVTRVPVLADGSVEVPAETVPMSKFLSPEGKAYLNKHLHDMQDPAMTYMAKGIPRFMVPYLERDKVLFPVTVQDTKIGGVHVLVFEPVGGVKASERERVLIDLHGGGFSGCWPGCAELESRPVASVGGMKVVSVDYREGPENKFPAASEDVAAVYRELLKTYKAEDVGVYGCSAGGMLTAESVAWFQTHGLPRPGAVGIFCAGAGDFGGDAQYTSTPLGEGRMMPMPAKGAARIGYFAGTNPRDPMVEPLYDADVMRRFPPTLVITGTRDFAMSAALYTHEQLVHDGVDAELHVWEGMFHGFFYNPDVPESQDAYRVMVGFFDKHLGR
ncbi:MAG: alpha/beta hydrolase fold domain-containing protein [Acidobacteriaceae bacterium]